MTDAPTFPVVVAEWPRNAREVVRVELDEFKGSKIVSIRTWFRDGDRLRPARSGMSIAIRHLPKMAAALAEAVDEARALGLVMDPAYDAASEAE